MPLLNSISRKYTPPTCTLEIKARESALSRWVKLPVLNQLEFKLSFDDPRQAEEKRVAIWGDRDELEALCEAVDIYVQNFLDQRPGQLPISLLPAAAALPRMVGSENGNGAAAANPFEAAAAKAPSVSKPDSPANAGETNSMLRGMLSPTPYLQPRGLLAHDLFLGPLATTESGPVVPLRALQLFDLATALDEYSTQMVALPQRGSRRAFKLQSPPVWTYATVAVLLIMAGLTPFVIKLINQPKNSTTTAVLPPTSQSSPSEPTSPTTETSPLPSTSDLTTTPNATSSASPLPSTSDLPTTPNATSSASPLPSTSDLTTTPNPTISPGLNTSPYSSSTPTVATSPGSALPTPPPSPTLSSVDPSPLVPPSGSLPRSSKKNKKSSRKGSQPGSGLPQTSSTLSFNPNSSYPPLNTAPNADLQPRVSHRHRRHGTQTVAAAPSSSSKPKVRHHRHSTQTVAAVPSSYSNPDVSSSPTSLQNLPDETSPSLNPNGSLSQESPQTLASQQTLPPLSSFSTPPNNSDTSKTSPSSLASPSSSASNTPQDTAALPRVSPSPAIPPIPDEPVASTPPLLTTPSPSPSVLSSNTPVIKESRSPAADNNSVVSSNNPVIQERHSPAADDNSVVFSNTPVIQERRSPAADANNIATKSKLSDTMPQLAQLKDKLQQRWKPPQGLTQSLEYTLVFNGDGSISRIIPLSDAATKYLGSTGMPMLDGKPFVSPIQGGHNSRIRVVLNSDGKVETHSEQ